MYKNYGKIYNLCNVNNNIIIDSEKFVEPNFQTYLQTGRLDNANCNDFENNMFVYGKKEHVSGYRYNPLYDRDDWGVKQLKYLEPPYTYDETKETKNMKGCRTCSTVMKGN